MRKIEVLSKKDVKEIIKKEIDKIRREIYPKLDKLREKIIDLDQIIMRRL